MILALASLVLASIFPSAAGEELVKAVQKSKEFEALVGK